MVGSAVSALNSTTLTAPTILDDYVQNIDGGYVRIANLVVVNIRCTIKTAFPSTWAGILSGFPKPIVRNSTNDGAVAISNNQNLKLSIDGNGKLWSNSAANLGDMLLITGTYFAK